MGVLLFTGFTLEEIAADPAKRRVVEAVDVILAGRFRGFPPDSGGFSLPSYGDEWIG